ncbi:hypothetical protein Plhal710r2_c060g0169711 [Plasmopara halstedii]
MGVVKSTSVRSHRLSGSETTLRSKRRCFRSQVVERLRRQNSSCLERTFQDWSRRYVVKSDIL